MINRIKSFMDQLQAAPEARVDPSIDDLHLAAAALLMEAARMDDAVDQDERERIAQLVRWRFGLSDAETAALVAEAERVTEDLSQWYGFTAAIRGGFSDTQRIQLIEMLWDVAYADGELHDMEANLLRRIAGLLYVSDRDSGLARQRVLARYGLTDDGAAS